MTTIEEIIPAAFVIHSQKNQCFLLLFFRYSSLHLMTFKLKLKERLKSQYFNCEVCIKENDVDFFMK